MYVGLSPVSTLDQGAGSESGVGLPTAPQGWVMCRDQILLYAVQVINNLALLFFYSGCQMILTIKYKAAFTLLSQSPLLPKPWLCNKVFELRLWHLSVSLLNINVRHSKFNLYSFS